MFPVALASSAEELPEMAVKTWKRHFLMGVANESAIVVVFYFVFACMTVQPSKVFITIL